MTMTEAAACGTPGVATRIAGLDATVDGVSGLLADTDDDLVGHLVSVLTDAALRERLLKGAIERGLKPTWEAAAICTLRRPPLRRPAATPTPPPRAAPASAPAPPRHGDQRVSHLGRDGLLILTADAAARSSPSSPSGHGDVPQPTDPAEYDVFEQYVLDRLPDEPVDAVGFSLGSRTLLVPRRIQSGSASSWCPESVPTCSAAPPAAALADALETDDRSNPMVHHFEQLAASSGQSI